MPEPVRKWNPGVILPVISVFAAILFWGSIPFRPFAASPLLKWFPVGLLAFYVFRHRKSGQEWTLALALVFHSAGDVLLDFGRAHLFLPAVGGFLLGHLFYAVTFLPDVRSRLRLTKGKVLLITGVLLYSILAGVVLLPRMKGFMVGPLSLYMVAIGTMVVMSLLPGYRGRWITVGALLYIASDSLIAVNQFVVPVPASHYLTWPSYYAGQFLIVTGFLREKSLSA